MWFLAGGAAKPEAVYLSREAEKDLLEDLVRSPGSGLVGSVQDLLDLSCD